MKLQRIFRYIWRANAVVVLIAASLFAFLAGTLLLSEFVRTNTRRRAIDAAPPVVARDAKESLFLGPVSKVKGTDTLRGELLAQAPGKGYSSGGYGTRTRNILFIDIQSGAARWLMSGTRSAITRQLEVSEKLPGEKGTRLVATVLLAKPIAEDTEFAVGKLILVDPVGRNLTTVDERARDVTYADLDSSGRISVLFERENRYVIASFDAESLEKETEIELSVPQLD